jgi:hypothetical protein
LFSVLLLISGTALAETFTFSYVGSVFSLTGTLTANSNGDGTYTAVGGSGLLSYSSNPAGFTVNLYPIPSADVPATVRTGDGTDLIGLDNLLLPSSTPMLDVDGLIFGSGSFIPPPSGHISGLGFNIYYSGGTYQSFAAGPDNLGHNQYAGDTGTFTLVDAPEPGVVSLLLTMLAGIVCLTGVFKKKLA